MNRTINILSTSRTALILLLATLLTATAAQTARAQDLTDFLPVSSSGTASGYFAFSDHFYKVDWTGINTSQTTSVQLIYNDTFGRLIAQTNGDSSSGITLYTNADASTSWNASDITGLTPGQSSDGYTSYNALSVNAGTKSAKVCTVTCMAANAPTWNWSADYSTCTATFTCTASPSLTATVNATVTTSGSTATASATFNGTNYSDTKTIVTNYDITYVLNGGTNAAGNPTTYADNVGVASFANPTRTGYQFAGWYDNASFTGNPVTNIPAGSSGNKTLYAKWNIRLTYNTTGGYYEISTAQDLVVLANYVNDGNNASGMTFKQTQDINMSSAGNFEPIGSQPDNYNPTPFNGTYDGQGHAIIGLTVNTSSPYAGLFGQLQGGSVRNLTMVNPNVTANYNSYGSKYAGGIVGAIKPGTIENCNVINPTLNPSSADKGAICGIIAGGGTCAITNCYYYTTTNYDAVGWNALGVAYSASRTYTLTLNDGITTSTVPAFSYGGTGYYASGTTITLGGLSDRTGYSSDYAASGNVTVTDNQFAMPDGDVTVTAVYTPITYTITYHAGESVEFSTEKNAYTVESATITLDQPSPKTGYTFSGWYGNAGLTGDAIAAIATGSTDNMELWAKWTPITYTVHFEPVILVSGTMADQTFTYDQAATALTKNGFSTTTGQWLRWNTVADGSGTDYEDEALVQNLTAEDGGVVTLYAQWRLTHRFHYDNTIFHCYKVDTPNEVYRAYAGETVKVEVINGTSEYTIRVVNGDGEDITLDTGNNFVMPNEEVWITYTSVKRMSYTTISLDNFESWDDVAYLYDANQPTVTPTVVVKYGETVLTEGTDYTVEITNNTGSATQMVTATVTVTGMGGYVGTNTQEFRITPFNIANCEIKGTLEAYDNGYGPYYPLERNVQVWNGDTQLEVGTDYTIELDPNIGAYDYVVGEQYQATVKGTGDWGGSQTFQFKVVELHHTVVFVANGGSGTMASDVATKGLHYTLPPCGFTAPDGKKFSHWVASCEPDAEKQPGDYFTAPNIYSESDVQTITVTAYWRDKATCTVTLPEEMEVVNGTLTDGKAIEDEVITFRPRPGLTATDVQANGTALTPDGEGIYTLTVTTDITVTVGALAPSDWATVNQGNSADPYMIYNKDQLLLLAHRVNGTNGETANDYLGKYFKLGANITFSHAAVEGDNYDENYEAIGGKIGGTDRYFKGNFDGDGHTVSGIRIRKTGSGTADIYQGLFGCISSGAGIYDVHLTDARIKGCQSVGGIVGYNVAGYIWRCSVTDSYITATGNANYGTICGRSDDTYRLRNNYYHGCTVNGTAVTSGVGCEGADITDNNGALPAYRLDLSDGVTIQTTMAADLGFTCDADNDGNAENYWRTGAELKLNYTGTVPDGYTIGYTATNGTVGGNANDGYTLTMPDQDVTITTAKTPDPAHFSVNDAGTEYTILTTTGWNVFCDLLADNAKGYFSDKTVLLGADITVTRMAGGENHAFTGTFDGQNYTLTLDYGTADAPVDAQFVAPFIETSADGDHQPTFRNLTIGGTIYEGYTGTEAHNVGGLIGHLFGTVTIEHCTSNVSINATSGAGGFVGLCEHSVSFNDCHSAAVIRSADGSNSGFVAWSRASAYTIDFTGCLFDGKLLQQNGSGSYNGGFIGWTGANKTVTITNSLCAPAPLADGETMASSGSATFARGWNATTTATNCYDTAAFEIAQGKATRTVAAADDVTIGAIALTGTATQYTVSGITAYSGGGLQRGQTLYYGSDDQLSLTLGNTAAGAPAGYRYDTYTASAGTLAADGTLTMPDADVTISVSTDHLASTGQPVAVAYVDADGTLHDGNDAAQAVALDGSETSLGSYGQEKWYFGGIDFSHTGKITCYGDVHIILCDGKTMTVDGNGSYALWSPFGNFYFYGQNGQTGTLNATGCIDAADNNAGILTINGGIINASGDDGISAYDIIINRGTVNATGNDGHGIWSGGNITLGWNKPTDRISITASSYYGTVQVASGKKLHNGTDFLGGTLGDPAAAVNGKTLRPAATVTYTTAAGTAATDDAILLDAGDNSLPAGNYLATGTLNYTHGITLTGNVTLILADNCHMNVGTSGERIEGKGIAHSGFPTLTITSEANGSGNGNGALNIYTTGSGNHGIITGAITINGGNVTADTDGYNAVALYAADTDLTINGGTVSATTANSGANAIYAYGNFNYNGGNVTATAANAYAIRAAGNYTFSWRTPADRITIGATGLYAPAAKTATFTRLFTDATGNYYGATLTGTALNALKGVTLEAAETADFTVTLAPKGYGTYYDGHYDITLPAGTQARIVTARGGTDGTLDYETIANGDDGITLPKTVPAGTAVMLCHDGGGLVTLTVNDADIDDRDFTKASGNTPGLVSLLHGSDVATETTGGTLYYKLTYGSAVGHESIFGWYWGSADGAAFESPAHKAWLALPAAEARSFIGLPEDETTGVTPLLSPEGDENGASPRGGLEGVAYYTLDGRKLDGTPMKPGIYVNNGKKVIIK